MTYRYAYTNVRGTQGPLVAVIEELLVVEPMVDAARFEVDLLLQTDANDDVLTERQVFVLAPIVVGLIGVLFWYVFAKGPIGRARMLWGLDAFDPSRASDDPELAAVRGTVAAGAETITAPLSEEEECVAYDRKDQDYRYTYRYDEDRRRRMRRRDEDDWNDRTWSWETTSTEREHVPFLVETDHGPVAVDPEGAHLEMPIEAEEKTSRTRRFLYQINPLTGTTTILGRIAHAIPGTGYLVPKRPERSVVRHLDPGERAVVIGDVAAGPPAERPGSSAAEDGDAAIADGAGRDAGSGDVVGHVTDANGASPYRITTRPLWRLRIGSLWRIATASVPGFVTVLLAMVIFFVGLRRGMYW